MKTLEDAWVGMHEAFSKKTIPLLGNRHAHFYISLFEVLFDPPSASVELSELVAKMNIVIEEFSSIHEYREFCPQENGSPKQAESIMRTLVDDYQWLEKRIREDGSVSCRLTSDAIEAVSIVRRLNERQMLMSGPRMQTIIDTAERAKLALSENYEEGRALLEERVARAQEDLDEYIATHGESRNVTFFAQDVVHNLNDLVSPMPAEISRYESALRDINSQFRREIALNNDSGAVITRRLYEERLNESLGQYRQSYRDAMGVKASFEQGDSIYATLRDIDSAASAATSEPLPSVVAAWASVTDSIARVSSVEVSSSSLVNHAITRAMERDRRELTQTLSQLERACLRWADSVAARGEVGFEGFTCQVEAKSMVSELGAPRVNPQPQRLVPGQISQSTEDFKAAEWVGVAKTAQLMEKLEAAAKKGIDLNSAFNSLDPDMRRLSEFISLIDIATREGSRVVATDKEARWAVFDYSHDESIWITRKIEWLSTVEGERADDR